MTSEPSERVPVESGSDPEQPRARHDALLAAVDAGVCYLDCDGCIAAADADFAELVGRSETAARGERLSAFLAAAGDEDGDVPEIDGAVERLTDPDPASDVPDETSLSARLNADGRPVTVRLRRVDADGGDGARAVAVVRDGADGRADAPREGVPDLEDAERQLESLVDAVEEYAIFVLDPDGYVASWNEGMRQIKGYEREEILGEHYSTFFTEADAEAGEPERRLAEARERGGVDMQGWRVRKDGSQFWANATLTPIWDDGDLAGYTKVTRDMSERRERRQRIREDRDLLQQVLETSPVSIAVLADDGRVVRSNVGDAEAFAGLSEDHRVGELDVYDADGEFVPPEERPYLKVFETGEPVEDWLGQVETQDERRWVCFNVSPLSDSEGDVSRVVVTAEDVTEFKRQEAQLERQRDELATEINEMFDRITDGFFGLNRDWEFTYVNERATELLDEKADDLSGENVWDLFDEASADQFRERYEYAMENQEAVNFEAYYEEPLDRWFHVSAYPSETGLSVYFRDVTERKEYERELAESEERYRTLVENLPHGAVTVFDTDLEYTLAGGGAFDDVDISPEDVVGNSVSEVFDEYASEEGTPHERALNGEHVTRDIEFGGRIYENHVRPIYGDDDEVVAAMSLSMDVTERKEYERELAESEERYRTLVEDLPDAAVVVFDEDLRFTLAGGGLFDDIDFSADDIIGDTLRETVPEAADEFEPVYREALAGEPAVFEVESEDGNRVYESHLRPIRGDDGEVVAGMNLMLDVTEQREYEETLTALNEATHSLPHAESRAAVAEQLIDVTTDVLGLSGATVYLHDPDAGVLYDAAHSDDVEEVYGTLPTVPDDSESSLTASAFAAGETRVYEDVRDSDLLANAETNARRSLFVPLGDHGVLVLSDTEAGAFEERTVELAELVGANGTSALDSVEREQILRESERELRRYERIVETVWDGVYALDDEGRFALVNDAFLELTGYDREELIGKPATAVHGDDVGVEADRMTEEVARGEREVGVLEFDLATSDGETVPVEARFGPYQYGAESRGRTGVIRDVTERKEHEEALQTRISQQEAITELGQYALSTGDFDDVIQRATEIVSETLGTDYCKVLDLDEEENELLLRAGVGWHAGIVGEATVRADTNSQAGYTLLTDAPVVVDDLDAESRFTGPDLLVDHDVTSGISTIIGFHGEPWGILGTHDTGDVEFTENDVAFVQNVANILANAVERERQERELEHQREQLAALNQLNRVVQGINRALVEKSSREEIEELVCDRLADTYEFAWVGEISRGNREVTVRTESGVENYLSDLSIALDDEVMSRGPTAMAIRTREMQVARNIPESDYAPGQEHAERYGYASSAAIPIAYEGSLYGVLNIYSERPDAFDGQEGAVLSQLGDIVGHAINSVERKQALMTDEMVELEFYLASAMNAVDAPAMGIDGEIRFERTIPTDDGEYLVYGSMTADARETMDALLEGLPHFDELRVLSEDGDEAAFELKLVDPPAISVVTSHGGRIANARLADGSYEMQVHLPQTADVREVVTALQEEYPGVELVAQRRTTKSESDDETSHATLAADLTDRQRAVLEAAFRSGFFEWPRESTGEDVADSVGITASTLHQHLRAAERKLVGTYLDG